MLRISRRTNRIRPNVTESAGHSHAVGPHQILGIVICRVGIEPDRVPLLLRRLIKVLIGEKTQADDACCIAVCGTRRDVLPARADFHAWVLLLVFEWIGGTVRAAFIQPKAKTVGVRPSRLLE